MARQKGGVKRGVRHLEVRCSTQALAWLREKQGIVYHVYLLLSMLVCLGIHMAWQLHTNMRLVGIPTNNEHTFYPGLCLGSLHTVE